MRDFARVQRSFPATLPLVILARGTERVVAEPAVLELFDGLQRHLAGEPDVVYTASYANVLHDVLDTVGGNVPRPYDREMLHQLVYLSYGPQYERFVTRDLNEAALWVMLREASTTRIEEVIRSARDWIAAHPVGTVQGEPVTIGIAGGVAGIRVALTEEITRGKLANI